MSIPTKGTLLDGNSGEINVRIVNVKHIQIDAVGAGTLAISTLVEGQTDFNAQTSITAQTIILDMDEVIKLSLSATGGDVDYAVSLY